MTASLILRSPFSLGLLLGIVGGASCWHRSPSHCANLEGDQTCAERGAGDYCSSCVAMEEGCVSVMPEGACHVAAPSGTTDSETTPVTTLEPGTETDMTLGPACVNDEECANADAPFCGVNGECGTCDETAAGDVACESLDSSRPVCLEDTCVPCTQANLGACMGDTPACDGNTNTCVQCTEGVLGACMGDTTVCDDDTNTCVECTAESPGTCTGNTPICDDASNTCVPCTAHEQCGQAAGNLFTGECLPADAVVNVGVGQEFDTLSAAVSSFGANGEGTIIVHAGTYNESVTVDATRVIAFLVAEDAVVPPEWTRTSGSSPQLTVNGGATVLMDGLRLESHASTTAQALWVRGSGSRAWLDRSYIVQNAGGGILVDTNAELTLRNCFVGNNSEAIGLEVNGASARVRYSTLTASTFGSTPAVQCAGPFTVDISNSIIVTQGGAPPDEVDCAGMDVIRYSATEGVVAGTGNSAVGTFPAGEPQQWFVDYAAGDYHLQNDGSDVFAGIALWQAGDSVIAPSTDIDGDPRPIVDGASDYAGADIPAP